MIYRSRRVLHVITTMNLGGAEKQLLILMREQVSLGHEVYISIMKPNPELQGKVNDSGVITLSVGMNLSTLMENRRFIKDKNIVVHAHLPRAELFARIMLLRRGNVFVVTKHNAENYGSGTKLGTLNWLSALVLRRAQAIVAISIAVKEFMLAHHQIFRNDMRKIEVIYYGAEAKKGVLNRPINRAFGFKLGTISRLVSQKNIDIQLEALKTLNDSYSDRPWRLTIIGEGPEKENLTVKARNLGLEKEVEFRGKVQNISEVFLEIDVFLLTSKYEGFGLVLLEAMAFNVPIVASSISAIPEVLDSSYKGLFSPGSSIDLVEKIEKCRDQTFRSEMTKVYKKRLKVFELHKSAKAILDLYERLRP